MAERGAWTYDDVVTENAALTTTGGRVWPAAYRLAEYLEHELDSMFPRGHAPTVLELGAGCGWLGLVLARNMAACECICLTEQEEGGGLEWLAHNVEVNKGRLPGVDRIVCAPCDWSWYMLQQQQQQQPTQHPAQQLQQQHGQPQQPGAHTSSSPTPQQQQQQQQLVSAKPAVPSDDGADEFASATERSLDSALAQPHAASGSIAATTAVTAAAAVAAQAAEAVAVAATEATPAAGAVAPVAAVAAAEAGAGAAATSRQPAAVPLAAQLKGASRLSPGTLCVQQQRQDSQPTQPDECAHDAHLSQEDASPSLHSSTHTSAHTCANAPEDAAASLPDRAVERLCPATGKPWDLLIGSDLIYTEQGCRMLPQVMRQLATPGHTRVLYCHTRHRFDHLDLLLMEELARAGLLAREVRERGVPTPPPSPPPLTELFPDFRIAVYSISFASAL